MTECLMLSAPLGTYLAISTPSTANIFTLIAEQREALRVTPADGRRESIRSESKMGAGI
jgi:hypothetical protein